MIGHANPEAGTGLVFDGIVKHYGNHDVLRGATWNIGRSEIGVVLGPNGAGKSTLMAILATLVQPDRGTFRVDGTARPIEVRARLGYLPHAPLLTPSLTVRENLLVAAGLHGLSRADTAGRVAALTDQFELAGLLDRLAGHCSRGQSQRASLAVALVHNPPVLLLDEPFTGLDAAARERLSLYVRAWRDEGRSILLVTHELADGIALADKVGCLVRGKIFEPPAELLRDPAALARTMEQAVQPVIGPA
ncbi:MAG: ABC transporter ATP-binding protein [Planctomycetota bacterium]